MDRKPEMLAALEPRQNEEADAQVNFKILSTLH
jgi:hypothetical protein